MFVVLSTVGFLMVVIASVSILKSNRFVAFQKKNTLIHVKSISVKKHHIDDSKKMKKIAKFKSHKTLDFCQPCHNKMSFFSLLDYCNNAVFSAGCK